MSKRVANVLKSARLLISNPNTWTQHAVARLPDGKVVDATNARAVCFCSLGALAHVTALRRDRNNDPKELDLHFHAVTALDGVVKSKGLLSIIGFNDNPKTTHADVLAAFDLAIEAERATP